VFISGVDIGFDAIIEKKKKKFLGQQKKDW